ncbi:MAG: glutamine--fructose-6-phosphate transaminase (isomerizing) [Chloroflexi bacterium]|nr:glutamine--fructose-6-phosphate transaminase (isomerizing) [Chloroflexota bacterium]
MCGIFGYVGRCEDAPQRILEGLKKLEYRGYDSWGIAVRLNGNAAIERHVGKIGLASTMLPASEIGLGHTRWATHGAVTEENAHPHLDCSGRLAVIHNGIVENHQALRRELLARGHLFHSQTDTEVIAHLLEDELRAAAGEADHLAQALICAFRKLDGLNALAVLDIASHRLAAAKTGSPLVLGWASEASYLASDPSALLEHTRRLTFLEDNQVAVLSEGGVQVFDATLGERLDPRIWDITWQPELADLAGYEHFMAKEIHEQPRVIHQIAAGWGAHAEQLAELMREARGTYMVGCGTAAHAALAAQYAFSRIAARHVNFANGSEFAYLEHFLNEHSLVIALSQSGETIDVLDSIRAAKKRGVTVGALVNVEGSSLYRLADYPVLLGAGPERCVLATKSFTAKLAILLLTAYAFDHRLEEGREVVQRAADEIQHFLSDGRAELMRQIAEQLYQREHLYIIGRGPSYPLALEAALKIKEVSYIHAEGFAGGELKHGVIALIEPGTPCLVIAPKDETYTAILSGAMEVKARGGFIIGLSPEPDEVFDIHVPLADVGEGAMLVNALPPQILAYHLALLRGCDPDKPRNLAKSVTVK